MKKFISIALAVIMVLAACPLTLFAAATSGSASDELITTNVCQVEYTDENGEKKIISNNWTSVAYAADAIGDLYAAVADTVTDGDDADTNIVNELYEAAGRPVIKILGNYVEKLTTNPNWANKDTAYTMVIDGAKNATENYTIYFGSKDATWTKTGFNNMAFYNSTFKNVNMVIERGANGQDNFFHGNGTWTSGTQYDFDETFITFENCVIDENATGVANVNDGLFKLNGRQDGNYTADKYTVTFKDCTVNSSSAIAVQVLWFAASDISFVNTTWTLDGTAGKDANNGIVKIMKCGVSTVNVDGNSKLIANRSTIMDGETEKGSTNVAIFVDNYDCAAKVTYNFAKGAEFIMNNAGCLGTTKFYNKSATDVVVNDNGAVYKVSAYDAKRGVTLPTFMDENDVEHLWKNGEEIIANPYTNAGATSEVTLKHEANPDPLLNPNNVCYIKISDTETKYFTSFASAITAAEPGATIVLMKDITSAAVSVTGKALTVDGKGKTITGPNDYFWSQLQKSATDYHYPLTFKNVTVNCYKGFWFNVDELNFENCTINTSFGLALRNSPANGADVKVNLTNTTWTLNSTAAEPLCLAGNGKLNDKFTINLVNSHLIATNGKADSSHAGNQSIFNVNTPDFTAKLDGTSSMVIKGQYNAGIIGEGIGNTTVELAEGATLKIENARAGAYFVNNAATSTVVKDSGANWVVGTEAAKNGVTLLAVKDAEGKQISWAINGVTILDQAKYVNATATEAVTLKLDANAKEPFAMINGAGLKTEGEGLGISFGISIDQSIIDRVGPEATYGIRIAPSEYAQFGFDAINEGQYVDVNTTVAGIVEGKCILGITGFPADDSVFLKLTVIGYASYYDTETSKTVTYYTPNTVEISLYELALIAAENGYADNANVKTILAQLY